MCGVMCKMVSLVGTVLLFMGCGSERPGDPKLAEPGIAHTPPLVTVISPNGAETLSYRESIRWTAESSEPEFTEKLLIDIHFSADSGATWTAITEAGLNNGTFDWDILYLPPGDRYLVRITATGGDGLSSADTSDAVFTIASEIYITDQTGKRWEIGHAVRQYRMVPDNWWFGLGPNAIRPINFPDMLLPGDKGYPSDGDLQRVVGTVVGGDVRAYPIDKLRMHEVVNDRVGGDQFAVIY
jgi:hypothetical protein